MKETCKNCGHFKDIHAYGETTDAADEIGHCMQTDCECESYIPNHNKPIRETARKAVHDEFGGTLLNERSQVLLHRIERFTEKLLTTQQTAHETSEIAWLNQMLENCQKAKKAGSMSQFGSASGSMMLNSAIDAFTERLKTLSNKDVT